MKSPCPQLLAGEEAGNLTLTKILRELCDNGELNTNVCLNPKIQAYAHSIDLLSLEELKVRLHDAGGAECVTGPMTPEDLTRKRVFGVQGTPLWSVYRKSCEGRYRELTSIEVLSVLYHYIRLGTVPGVGQQRGIVMHGDSITQNLAFMFAFIIRDQQHHIHIGVDYFFIQYTDHDEYYYLPAFRQQQLRMDLRHRCIAEAFHPGYIVNPPSMDECVGMVEDVLLTILIIRESFPDHPMYKTLRRSERPVISANAFNYWWDQEVENTSSIVEMTQAYFEFEEKQYEKHFSNPIVKAARGLGGAAPPDGTEEVRHPLLYFYNTVPERFPVREVWEYPVVINETELLERNVYLRSLPWQRTPQDPVVPLVATPSNTKNPLPVHRYLLDLNTLVKSVRGIAHTLDGLHFMCAGSVVTFENHFFCGDGVTYAEAQWYLHVIADELITNAFPNEHR